MKTMSKAELRALAANAASSAPIRKCATGEGLGLSPKDWATIVRQPHKVSDYETLYMPERGRKLSDNELIEQRIVNGDHVYNGLGELIAVERA